jgi:cytochrome c oxidase subunit III
VSAAAPRVETREIDARDLTRVALGRRSTLWWGVLLLVVIEAVVLFSMVSSYYYLTVVRGGSFPPPGTPPPDLELPLVQLACALASLAPAHLAVRFARLERVGLLRASLLLGALLMVGYFSAGMIETQTREHLWSSHSYGSIVWTMSGYQYFHVIALAGIALGFLGFSFVRSFSGHARAPLQASLLYWDFVVAAGVLSFVTLYLSPRLL